MRLWILIDSFQRAHSAAGTGRGRTRVSQLFMNRTAGIVWAILASIMLWWPVTGDAQTATVKRNVNLRQDPSTNQNPIRLLHPPE